MNYKLLKQAAEVIKPKIDWHAAQKSNEVGFVSPEAEPTETLEETKPLPAPTGTYKAPRPTKRSKNKKVSKKTRSVNTPKSDTPETPLPMTPGYASLYNEELKDEETPRYKSWSAPEGSPWHPGYSRVPNTIDPNKKNWELNEPGAAERLFGPPESDWRKRNPATWFNVRTYPRIGVFDEEAAWEDYKRHNTPWAYQAPAESMYGIVGDTEEKPELSEEERNLKAWDDYEKEDPVNYAHRRESELDSMSAPYDRANPMNLGPYTDVDESWDNENDKADLYNTALYFPDQISVDRGFVRPTKDSTATFDGVMPLELIPPYSDIIESTGAHEATHNIAHSLSNDSRYGIVPYPLRLQGLVPWHSEIPTVATESIYNRGGKFLPEIIPSLRKPMRMEEDEYLRNIMPTADATRVDMTGQIDPTSIDSSDGPSEFVNSVNPKDLYNKGIRYWNGPHNKDREAVSLDKLRFIPDDPVGWHYDRFGNKRLSGGELTQYQDLYGDTKPKDMDQLSPNTRRFFKNLGQAPQAWIDAVDHPKEYAAAQDNARRIMFPLLRKDISGMFRDGDVESIKLLRDYQHPAFQMMTDLVDGKNFFDLTDQERSDIMDKVEAIYPELRLDPVATPSWLVHAQKEFGLLPEMGVTGVRTLDQYNDIARYDAYYRALDEYLSQYGNQGGGYYGI